MATINKVSCFVNSSEQSAFFVAGCGNGSDYYFWNKYTRIPNEFNLFRPYFPKMLFSEIVEAVQKLMSIAGRYTGLSGEYSFQVGFDNGTEKTFWVSGKSMVAMDWEHIFSRIVAKYNSIYKDELPKITPHVCRHTCANNLANSGMAPAHLQYYLGHSDISVTMENYVHTKTVDAKDEIARLKKEGRLKELA